MDKLEAKIACLSLACEITKLNENGMPEFYKPEEVLKMSRDFWNFITEDDKPNKPQVVRAKSNFQYGD